MDSNRNAIRMGWVLAAWFAVSLAVAQETDVTQTPNTLNAGIQKSYTEEIGAGRGNIQTPTSSIFIIRRDPFRSIVRGRQLFQRKFRRAEGHGPRIGDGVGNIEQEAGLGAGLGDSCATCHARPRGSAGFGGDVFTRPDSRDAPHLFGLGLVEMLADEITSDLRLIRSRAIALAASSGHRVTLSLKSKGIDYGSITAVADGALNTSEVRGVDADLRVRPFFAEGSLFSMREFAVGAFAAEMGMQSPDLDLERASKGHNVVTPSGLQLNGSLDTIGAAPVLPGVDGDGDGVVDEIPMAVVDHMEFYLLNYFRPGRHEITGAVQLGRTLFETAGCAQCHIPDLMIEADRRVADTETVHDTTNGIFNNLFTTALPLFETLPNTSPFPAQKAPLGGPFLVKDIYADFKRHDLGPAFYERNFDGTTTKEFVTEPLWGVGSTSPYGHDGRSINLREVILRHGGEAKSSKQFFVNLSEGAKRRLEGFLESLVLFPPPDTASNLNPGDPLHPSFPQEGHGSIDLSVLFNDPTDKE